MTDQADVVLRTDHGGVRVLTWHRPERNNAWTLELEERYFEALAEAAADPRVRAIVVTGSGRSFCPGMDAEALATVAGGGQFAQQGRVRQTFPLAISKPIIAAINGACAGIGLVQALMCDVRFAGRPAKLATAFSRRGLPAENAIAWMLTRLVGHGVAADLLISGRTILADEARDLGLVNQVVEADDLLPHALSYAEDLATSCSPRAMADIKRQLYESLETGLEHARRDSKRVFELARDHDDFREGVRSFTERRAPAFEGIGIPVDLGQFRD